MNPTPGLASETGSETLEHLCLQVFNAESEYLQAAKDVEKAIFRRNKAQLKFTTLRDAYENIKASQPTP